MISPDFAILGALLPLPGYGAYIWKVLHSRVQPNLVSWSLWAAAALIAFAAEVAEHTGLRPALVTLSLGLGPLAIVLASLTCRGAYRQLTPPDILCGVLSFAAVGLWLLTRKGDVAIVFAILADGLAAVPTVRKSYAHPQSENAWTYLASGTGAVITLLTVRNWTLARCGFPAYVAVVCAVISSLILISDPPAPPGLAARRIGHGTGP